MRKRGNQVVIVRGEREPGTGNVRQDILFTIFTKAEAKEAIGKGSPHGAELLRSLLEDQYPDVRFDWPKIRRAIASNMDVLPEIHRYRDERLLSRFHGDLYAFARTVVMADPEVSRPAAQLFLDRADEIRFLIELLQDRLKRDDAREAGRKTDDPFFWRTALGGKEVPSYVEEVAAGYFVRRELDRAEAAFKLLTGCFEDYAEGHNYLGLVALDRGKLDEAIACFEKTVEVGRRLFPKRIAKSRYGANPSTRPYIRGLINLVHALNDAGRSDDALAVCERLEKECGARDGTAWHRAVAYLNAGKWVPAAQAARSAVGVSHASIVVALALYETGDRREALAAFLHGALAHPRAVRMLYSQRRDPPRNNEEVSDHNIGVNLQRSISKYRMQQSPESKRFFRRILRDPRVTVLLDEVVDVGRRRIQQHASGEREAFDRLMEMKTSEFAREQAAKLADLAGGKAGKRRQD
ncbi:MAG: hypothetical protein PHU25_08865 [Deltaproteobacteria bacterium]|nr:hypothetical protein [Deltaproteobacteria bacterium]